MDNSVNSKIIGEIKGRLTAPMTVLYLIRDNKYVQKDVINDSIEALNEVVDLLKQME